MALSTTALLLGLLAVVGQSTAPGPSLSRSRSRIGRGAVRMVERKRPSLRDNALGNPPCDCGGCAEPVQVDSRRDFLFKSLAAGLVTTASASHINELGDLLNPRKSFAWCMANRMGSYEESVRQAKLEKFNQLFAALSETSMRSRRLVEFDTSPSRFKGLVYLDTVSNGSPSPKPLMPTLGSSGVKEVLEIGIGPAPNMDMYKQSPVPLRVTGIDANSHMGQYAIESAESAGVPFKFVVGDTQRLPFPDNSFDAVVGTHVLCSVEQPERALEEISRVLKPGGRYLFWEHVRAWEDKRGLQFQQDILDPLQQVFFQGCHLNRETLDSIQQSSSFSRVEADRFYIGDRLLLSPHVAGLAIAPAEISQA